MANFEERIFVSEFNVHRTGNIGVRKTTEVCKDGDVISQIYWRCVLVPNDPKAEEVLGAEPYYFKIAQSAWALMPQGK